MHYNKANLTYQIMTEQQQKAQFFALYFNQQVWGSNGITVEGFDLDSVTDAEYLLLTPLFMITDEDAIDLNFEDSKEALRFFQHTMRFESADFLRSRGYALPWMGISVEEQIKRGWVKLREQQSK